MHLHNPLQRESRTELICPLEENPCTCQNASQNKGGETIAVALPQQSNSNSDSLQPGNEIQKFKIKGQARVDKGCDSGRTPGLPPKKKKC